MKNTVIKRFIAAILCLCTLLCTCFAFSSCKKEEQPEAPITVLRFTANGREGTRVLRAKVEEVTLLPSELPSGVSELTLDEISAKAYYLNTDVTIGDYVVDSKITTEKPADDKSDAIKWMTNQSTTDFIMAEAQKGDSYEYLQKLIDDNPNRTLYFPDGVYKISKPLVLPTAPEKRVSLRLSQYAVIAVSDANAWVKNEPVLYYGKGESVTDETIDAVGARIYLTGGTIDGKDKADAIHVEGSGNLLISHVAMKNFATGLTINTNNVDVDNLTGIGNLQNDSICVVVNGSHNTLSNFRICDTFHGIKLTGGGNIMRNLHPLLAGGPAGASNTYGFWDESDGNFYDYCYADQHTRTYMLGDGNSSVINGGFGFWYTSSNRTHWGIECKGRFNSVVYSTFINLESGGVNTAYLIVGEEGGNGKLVYPTSGQGNNPNDKFYDYAVRS